MTTYFTAAFKNYLANYSGLPLACWQRIGLALVNDISGAVSFFLSLYFVHTLHFNIAVAGTIISCYGIGTTLGGVVGGKLADNISPTIVAIISLLLKAIAFIGLIQLKTVAWIMVDIFLIGLSTYAFKTSNNVWVLNHCNDHEDEKLKTINIIYVANNLGLGLGAAFVSTLSSYGFEYIFLVSATLLFLAAVNLTLQEKNNVNTPLVVPARIQPTLTPQKSLPKISNKVVYVILGCLFFYGFMIAQLSTTYPLYLEHAFPQLGITAVSIVFMLNCILVVFFQTPVVNYFNHYNKILMIGIGAALYGVGMLLLPFATIYFFAIILCVMYTFGEMLFFANSQLIVYQHGAIKKKGQSLGIYQSVFACSMIVGPTLGGFIYHHFGDNIVWYVCGIIGLSSLLICNYYKNSLAKTP